MKKLLALSIALLSLNAKGEGRDVFERADDALLNSSLHGLEGWGKEAGVYIVFNRYKVIGKTNKEMKKFYKAIENQVELKLRLAGIKVVDFGMGKPKARPHMLYIDLLPINLEGKDDIIIGYALSIEPKRRMIFKSNGEEYLAYYACISRYGKIAPPNPREHLDKTLDQLLLDYLKANPKPKEKKSLKEP